MDHIDYGKLVDEAMHIIVRRVLKDVEKNGLPGNHHFFISFLTKFPNVKLSKNLSNKYPKEMTIVLQYQFQNLSVEEEGFSVVLSFNGTKETIYIPYKDITTFADPSVQFGLQFREMDYTYDDSNEELNIEIDERSEDSKQSSDDNVVDLDKFRKK
jgi:hypothetical protein